MHYHNRKINNFIEICRTKFNQQKTKNIKILYWNANRLNKKGKIFEFKACINETYFIEKRKPPKIKGYEYIAKLREQTVNPRENSNVL